MTKPRILVVDDDRTTVDFMSASLRQGGYDVNAAYDAMQGFSAANRLPPSLIILDVNMPAGGGVQMLVRLRSSSRTAAVPVLIVTASQENGLKNTLQAKGATEILAKPVEREVLLEAVGRLLGESPPA